MVVIRNPALLERVKERNGVASNGSSKNPLEVSENLHFSDGDNFTYNGDYYRLDGVDTAETDKVWHEEDKGKSVSGLQVGERTGDLEAEVVAKLAKDHGFTKGVPKLDADGQPVYGVFGRPLGDLVNDKGQKFSDFLISRGITGNTVYSSHEQQTAAVLGEMDRLQLEQQGLSRDTDHIPVGLQALKHQDRTIKQLVIDGIDPATATPEQIQEAAAKHVAPIALTTSDFRAGTDAFGNQLIYDPNRVATKRHDVDLEGYLYDSDWGLKEQWQRGVNSGLQGYYGGVELFADMLDDEKLADWSIEKKMELAKEARKIPELRDLAFFDARGNWTVDGIGDFIKKTTQFGASSAPYLGLTLASGVAGAAVGTAVGGPVGTAIGFGIGITAPALVYAGQVYNEQEIKDPTKALTSGIAQGVLDRLALPIKFLPKKGAGIFSAPGKQAIYKEIVKSGKAKSIDEAQKLLTKTYQDVAFETLKAIGKVGAAETTKGIVREGITETGQEALALWGADKPILNQDGKNQLKTAAIVGGALGGSLGGIAGVVSSSSPVVDNVLTTFNTKLLKDGKIAEEVRQEDFAKTHGSVSAIQHANSFRGEDIGKFPTSLNAIINGQWSSTGSPTAPYSPNVGERIQKFVSGAWRGSYDHAILPVLNTDAGKSLATWFGVGNLRPGRNYQTFNADVYAGTIGENQVDAKALKEDGFNPEAAQEIYNNLPAARKALNALKAGKAVEGTFDPATLEFLKRTAKAERQLEQETLIASKDGKTPWDVDLLRPVIDRHVLGGNTGEFKGLVKKHTKLSDSAIEAAVNRLTSTERVTGSPFDKTEANETTTEAVKEIMNAVHNEPDFAKFSNRNPFENAQAQTAITSSGLRDFLFVGEGGAMIAKALASDPNLTDQQRQWVAQSLKEVIEAEHGTKQIKSPTMRFLLNSTTSIAAVLFLPFATISSLTEIVLVLIKDNPNITPVQALKVVFNSIAKPSKKAAEEFHGNLAEIGKMRDGHKLHSNLKQRIHYGFEDVSVKAARRLDTTGVGPRAQKFMDTFFKMNLLEGWTQWMRNLRITIAQSAIETWGNIYFDPALAGKPEWKAAEEKLLSIGIEPQALVNYRLGLQTGIDIPTETQQAFQDNVRLGVINFVNQGVATPSVGSRPVWYSDPHYKLFTQFTGFTSTITAKFLPAILHGLFKGQPREKISLLTMIAGMLGVGWFTLYLKALLYGDEEDREALRSMDEWRDYRRVLNATGLLGTIERGWDFVSPLYGGSPFTGHGYYTDSWLGRRWDDISGQAPVLSLIDSTVSAGGDALKGEFPDLPGRYDETVINLYDYLFK